MAFFYYGEWNMSEERGMSEVMHLELIVNSIYVGIVTVNT